MRVDNVAGNICQALPYTLQDAIQLKKRGLNVSINDLVGNICQALPCKL